jgi:osmoprotectant transport system substrate-binding protein
MGELYGIALAAAGFTPEIRKVGDLEKTELAVERGEVQVAAESVGRVAELLNVRMHGTSIKQQGATSDMTSTMHNLKNFSETYGLVLGRPSEAADQTAFAVTKDFADQHGVRTLSELAAKCAGGLAVLGGPPECPKQSLCQQGLEKTYGLTFGSFTSLDAGGPMTKDALRTGKISVGQVRSADGDVVRA